MKSLFNWLKIGAEQNPNKGVNINLGDYLTVGNDKKLSDVYNAPSTIVNLIVRNLFVVAGILIFFMIIAAGFSFLSDSDKGKEEAKNLVTGAVVGFLVMFSAYWIVQIIKLVTGTDIPI